MTLSRSAVCRALIAALALTGSALAQDKPKPPAAQPGTPPGIPGMPTPGPEHAIFQNDAGTWDATVEVFMAPGTPPSISKGVEVNTIGCSGLCLITDFKSEMMGAPFHGHGTSAWDATKKKYVGNWMDSMSVSISNSEATYDAAKKTMTGYMEGPDMSGKVSKTKAVTEWKDADTRVFTIYAQGPDGKETPGLRITYKRRK